MIVKIQICCQNTTDSLNRQITDSKSDFISQSDRYIGILTENLPKSNSVFRVCLHFTFVRI